MARSIRIRKFFFDDNFPQKLIHVRKPIHSVRKAVDQGRVPGLRIDKGK
jgi:hypothetical protein